MDFVSADKNTLLYILCGSTVDSPPRDGLARAVCGYPHLRGG